MEGGGDCSSWLSCVGCTLLPACERRAFSGSPENTAGFWSILLHVQDFLCASGKGRRLPLGQHTEQVQEETAQGPFSSILRLSTSPFRTGPLTFQMKERLVSFIDSTPTCAHCPCEPVLPSTLVTLASLMVCTRTTRVHDGGDLLESQS
uniref:Uncharacterized protein n=1 Tax=Mus musculus TaxID=10090 RepID=Q3V3R3_MOUSE|nr:unnamed protein product [Mus musculus]